MFTKNHIICTINLHVGLVLQTYKKVQVTLQQLNSLELAKTQTCSQVLLKMGRLNKQACFGAQHNFFVHVQKLRIWCSLTLFYYNNEWYCDTYTLSFLDSFNSLLTSCYMNKYNQLVKLNVNIPTNILPLSASFLPNLSFFFFFEISEF